MIKAILFDYDGTLVDTNELIISSYQHTLKKHLDIDITPEQIVINFGEPLQVSMNRYATNNNLNELLKTYVDYNVSKHDKMIKQLEGVHEALSELKEQGTKIAIVSSKRKVLIERGLNLLNLAHLIDIIVACEDTDINKPNGDPAIKGCELLGVDPGETIMVGDSHNDIFCGKNAGCFTCLVKYTALNVNEILKYKPDYTVDKLTDLLDLVNNYNKGVI